MICVREDYRDNLRILDEWNSANSPISLPFELADHGRYFYVLMIGDYVVKVPKQRRTMKRLDKIVEVQNIFAESLDYVVRARRLQVNPDDEEFGAVLVMPRIRGKRLDRAENYPYGEYRSYVENLKEFGDRNGFEVEDTGPKNWIWDGETFWFIDFSGINSKE